jgi:hypothetical protein
MKTYDRYIQCTFSDLHNRARERGYLIDEVKMCVTESDESGYRITVDTHHPSYPMISRLTTELKQDKPTISSGAGTELKKLLKMVGITSSPNCSCNARARTMDDNGILWCKNNQELIVSWLKEEASKRRLPFANFVGKKIVKLAISRAEKKENPSNE